MSSARAERLVNLVLCLLSTRQFLSADRIRRTVPGYPEGDPPFFRMFERDKAELRELGVPLEIGPAAGAEAGEGYRIARQDYELGEIDLAPDEAAAVALAARMWDAPELAGPAQGALLKLRAAGVEVDEEQGRTAPRVRTTDPALAPLLAALRGGRAVRFTHRRAGAAPDPAAGQRTVEPWGVVSWRGRWYLVGHDRDRGAPRSFRVSRIHGPITPVGPDGAVTVPVDVDIRDLVRRSVDPPAPSATALVWVAAGRAHGLRRLGRVRGPAVHRGRDGDELEIAMGSQDTVARWLAGHGTDVAVLDPPELADRVRDRWAGAAAAHTVLGSAGPADSADSATDSATLEGDRTEAATGTAAGTGAS